MGNEFRTPRNFTFEQMSLLHQEWEDFEHVRIFEAVKNNPTLVPFFEQLRNHRVIEIGGGKDPVNRTYQCRTYLNADGRRGDDGLTILEGENNSSAVVVSFGVLNNDILNLTKGRKDLFYRYAQDLFSQIKRVSYPFAILRGTDVEKYFGEPTIGSNSIVEGGVYFFNS